MKMNIILLFCVLYLDFTFMFMKILNSLKNQTTSQATKSYFFNLKNMLSLCCKSTHIAKNVMSRCSASITTEAKKVYSSILFFIFSGLT